MSRGILSILDDFMLDDLAKIVGEYLRFEGIEVGVLEGHTDWVTSLTVLPDGRLVSGSDDETIRISDLASGTSQVLKDHTSSVTTLTVLPDGRLVSGSYDTTIRIWDLDSGKSQIFGEHTCSVTSLTVLPDGRF